jgi:branched-chain amino acid transport system permease protein
VRAAGRLARLVPLLLPGCGPVVDQAGLDLCRATLPALHAEGSVIRELRHGPAPRPASGIRIDYLAQEPGRPRTAHHITCRVEAQTGGHLSLVGLDTERGPLGEVRLAILRRWWLGERPDPSSEGTRRDADHR